MLELSDVSRSAGGEAVLTRASFALGARESLSILGLAAGTGPALFRLLDGTDAPETGSVMIGGRSAGEARKRKFPVARIDRRGVAPLGKTVRRVLERGDRSGAAALAERVGLKAQLDVSVKQLALDQRLRLAVAVARGERAELVLLDAPAEELIGAVRDQFLGDLRVMLDGMSVVHVASAADEARALGGRTLVLRRGRVVQLGTVEEVFGHPRNLVVAEATSEPQLNQLQVTMESGAGKLSDRSSYSPPPGVRLPHEGPCTLGFRPDDLGFGRREDSCVRFAVRCAGEETIHGRRFIRVTFAGANWLAPSPETPPAAGLMLNAFVERTKLMVFDAEGQAFD